MGLCNPPLHFLRESRNLSSCAPLPVRCAHLQPGIYRLPNPTQRAPTGLRTPLPPRFRTCIPVPAHGGVRGEGVGMRVALRKHDGGGEMPRWTGGLRQPGRTAGRSRVRRAVTGRSHEGSSFRRSGEVACSRDYSQSGAAVKQRGNDENHPSVVYNGGRCIPHILAIPRIARQKRPHRHMILNW